MANYDIIGGIVSPEALKEIQALEKSVDAIAAKLQGMTLGSASKGNADMSKQIKDLEAQIKRLTDAKAKGLTVDAKMEAQMQRQQEKMRAIAGSSSQYVTELQKMEARMKLLNIELQKMVANKQTESTAYLKGISDMKGMATAYEQMSKASGMAQMKSTSMYGSTFQLTQVMRELPNFAIDARVGFMSLSNNLPMLTDSFKQLSLQINEVTGKAYGFKGAAKIFAQSLLSINTIMIVASTLLVLYGKDIVNWIGNLFKATDAVDNLTWAQKALNKVYADSNNAAMNQIENIIELGVKVRKYGDDSKYAKEIIDEFNTTFGTHFTTMQELKAEYPKLAESFIQSAIKMAAAQKLISDASQQLLRGQQAKTILSMFSAEQVADSKKQMDEFFAYYRSRLEQVGVDDVTKEMNAAFTEISQGTFDFGIRLNKSVTDTFTDTNKKIWAALTNQKGAEFQQKQLEKSIDELYEAAFNKKIDGGSLSKDVFDAYNQQIADLVRKLDELNQMVGGETADGYINSIEKRLAANELFYRTSLDLLEAQKKEEQEKAKGNQAELSRIDDEYYLKSLDAFRDYKSKQVKILNDAKKDIEQAQKAETEVFTEIHKNAVDGWLDMMKKAREDNLKDAIDKGKEELKNEEEKERLRKDLVRDSITGAMELINSLNELYLRKLEEQGERMSQIEQAKLNDVKLKEEAGLLTKIQSEEEKAKITDYYNSVQEELDRKKAEADKMAFLLKQALALGEVWINYGINISSPENVAGALTPLYTALAVAATGVIAAQTIPAFADGGIMDKSGKALLGDGGKNELGILPDGRLFITPDVPTVFDIPRGTEILPDVNAIDLRSLIAMKQVMPSYSGNDRNIISELRDVKKAIQQKDNGNFYGMPLIKQVGQSERFYYRKRSLMN